MPEPLLEARGIVKNFGRVRALRGANFTVFPNEVVALVGDNGAGKSTLVKILAGVHQPDEGEILFDGQHVEIHTPLDARRLGIETVYQDLALAAELDAGANMFLGREIMRPGVLGRLGFIDKQAMRVRSREAFTNLGVALQDTPLRSRRCPAASARASRCRARSPGRRRSCSWTSRPRRSASSRRATCST
jgi:simple sugar transport system ATP-binding protein